jgi:MFS transporter, SP family, solute carrier family 2 (myo-inositol transporter), member 13
MYYAGTIYEMSEFNEKASVWLSGFTALAQVVGVAISISLVDRVGRRVLVLWSLSGVALSLIGLGTSFYLARVSSEPVVKSDGSCSSVAAMVWSGNTSYCYDCSNIHGCGFCNGMCIDDTELGPTNTSACSDEGTNWIYDKCHNPYGWLSVFFMICYLFTFGIGMGGLPWTINSEIYPLAHRSLAVSYAASTNWICNLFVAASFLSITSPQILTAYGAFWMYAAVSGVGVIWLFVVLPETKGLHLEDIDRLFQGKRGQVEGYDAVLETENGINEDNQDLPVIEP